MDSTDSYPKEYADSAWFKRLGELGFPMGGNTYDGTAATMPHNVKTWSDPASRQELYRAYLVRPCGGNAMREVGYHLWPVHDAEGNFQSWAWTAKWPGWNGKRDSFPLSKGDLWAYWPMAESGIDRLPDFPCEYFSQPIEEGLRQQAENFLRFSRQSRGILKTVDENRELLECLQQRAPDLLEECPWIDGWIAGTDIFLVDMMTLFGIQHDSRLFGLPFPRPWPGKFPVSECYGCGIEASKRHSSAQ